MPYLDPEKQKRYQREWDLLHPERMERARRYWIEKRDPERLDATIRRAYEASEKEQRANAAYGDEASYSFSISAQRKRLGL